MAHFDIPLDLPHASRIADRIQTLLEKHTEELEIEAPELMDLSDQLSAFLFRHSEEEGGPALASRDEAAAMGRQLVDEIERAEIRGDRLGQLVRNLFECLELGREGAEISLRAGENPGSLQRPL